MTLKIAEIGLNHFGRMDYLYDYINFLSQKKIDGITIQIIKKESREKVFYYVFHEVAMLLELSPFKIQTSYK